MILHQSEARTSAEGSKRSPVLVLPTKSRNRAKHIERGRSTAEIRSQVETGQTFGHLVYVYLRQIKTFGKYNGTLTDVVLLLRWPETRHEISSNSERDNLWRARSSDDPGLVVFHT